VTATQLDRVVVVGAGLAGLRAAEALRAGGFAGRLDVVGAERHPPYTRPPLSKAVLVGEATLDDCALHGADALDAHWRLGAPAAALDLSAREIKLFGGERLPFDGLVLATGAHARPWPGDAPAPAGALVLRDADDAERLRAALSTGPRRVLVVGAGFIGSEVVSAAAALGHAVALVELEPQPLARLLGPQAGALIAAAHRAHGVGLRTGTTVERFAAGGAAHLSDGTRIAADVCVLALGAVPSSGWLEGSGVALDRGIVCAADLRVLGDDGAAPLDRVVAAGDVVRWPHPLLTAPGEEPLGVGHWSNAAEQGAHAARTLLATAAGVERGEPFGEIPTFWSAIHDLRLRSVGVPALADETCLLEGDLSERRGVIGYLRAGRLVGALAIDANRRAAAYRDRIGQPLTDATPSALRSTGTAPSTPGR
jgi:NADPH-dependent 2,4-dienoyl-CoA reductase/sulfur reductase-like enzyme